MQFRVKEFLENHADLLDTDMKGFFELLDFELNDIEVTEVINMLKESDIIFKPYRDEVLIKLTKHMINCVSRRVSLNNFILAFLSIDSSGSYLRLGYTMDEMRQAILENRDFYNVDFILKDNDYIIYPRV